MGRHLGLKTVREIRAKREELRKRCELSASLYGPMKRIRGKGEDSAKVRFAASLATGFGANLLDWVLGDNEKDAKRREREGDYE